VTDPRDRVPIRAADIKELNERLVLGMVFRESQASQSEVTVASGLKAPTVFRIFGELEQAGLIAPVLSPPTLAADRKGRRPTWYSTVPGAYRVVGLDFRAGAASVVVEDFAASVLYTEERQIPLGAGADLAYAIVAGLAEDALERSPGGPLLGIGVGAPGVVDLAHGSVLEYMRIPGLSGFPLADMLEERFGAAVRMGNNATVAALAAYRYGSACGPDCGDDHASPVPESTSAFALLVRSGVGGAFIRKGIPYESGGKTALEIGHMTMDPTGPACPCGSQGCLEAYLSEDALIASVNSRRPCRDFLTLDGLLEDRDATTIEALGHAVAKASVALLSIRHLLDPDEFIIISRSAALSTFIAGQTGAYVAAHPRPDGSAPVVRGYRWDPVLAGRAACDMVFDGFFA
jgi:predicted NBD/HSP70 family sugar kinase